MRRYALRDDQWDRISDLLPGRKVSRRYGGGQPFVRRGGAFSFSRGHSLARSAGAFRRLEEHASALQPLGRDRGMGTGFQHLAADADNEYAMIDSTIVRAHQHSAGAQKKRAKTGIGRSRGGLSTKIHTLVDALGNAVGFHLTGGQAHDLVGADELLPDMKADFARRQGLRCRRTGHQAARGRRKESGDPIKGEPKSTETDRHLYAARH